MLCCSIGLYPICANKDIKYVIYTYLMMLQPQVEPVACPGIRKIRKSEILFFCFSIFQGGGPAQKIADK